MTAEKMIERARLVEQIKALESWREQVMTELDDLENNICSVAVQALKLQTAIRDAKEKLRQSYKHTEEYNDPRTNTKA